MNFIHRAGLILFIIGLGSIGALFILGNGDAGAAVYPSGVKISPITPLLLFALGGFLFLVDDE